MREDGTEAPTGELRLALSESELRGITEAERRITEGASEPGGPAPRASAAPEGYSLGEVIGRGGMGEVVLARHQQIGRSVAIKRMRAVDPHPDAVKRFVREAKLQARLEHPAIVPVHELGTDADGQPFFTMKRLAGVTLLDVLGDDHVSLQRLLRAFVDVCRAVEFAHARGVIHRDVKPANIMLGDFGEVYLLDWGVALELGDARAAQAAAEDESAADSRPRTQAGALLGTPGYMSPEQARGELVGAPTDVYALGAILFEVLAAEPLHPRDDALASTLSAVDASAARRRRDRAVPPELDLACAAALAPDPTDRPTARALGDAVQRYLDGDRDVERRRALVAAYLAEARAAVASGDLGRRGAAMQAAGRALALDPASADAAAIVTTLMLEPPRELPRELRADLAALDREQTQASARTAMWSFAAILAFLPLVLWNGVTDRALVAVFFGYAGFLVWLGWYAARTGRPPVVIALVCNAAFMFVFERLLGPFIVLPGILGLMTMALASQSDLLPRPWLVIGVLALPLVAPLALEAAGWLAPTWGLEHGRIITRSAALAIDGAPTLVLVVAANVGTLIVNGLFGRALATAHRDAQQRLEIQAWHLRKLLPVAPPRP